MGVSRKAEPGPIERATPSDLVMLAMDRKGATPEQLGAVLVLDAGPGTDVATVERAVEAVPIPTSEPLRESLDLAAAVWHGGDPITG